MIETLSGTLIGGSFRLVPEVLKWLERKNERQHALAMLERKVEELRLKGDQALQLDASQVRDAISATEAQAPIEVPRAKDISAGPRSVDVINALIRPLLALIWLILLWPAMIVGGFIMALQAGIDPLAAMDDAFGPREQMMASSIASFWLVDRSLRNTEK